MELWLSSFYKGEVSQPWRFQPCGSTFLTALKRLGWCNTNVSVTMVTRSGKKINFCLGPYAYAYGTPYVKTTLCHIPPWWVGRQVTGLKTGGLHSYIACHGHVDLSNLITLMIRSQPLPFNLPWSQRYEHWFHQGNPLPWTLRLQSRKPFTPRCDIITTLAIYIAVEPCLPHCARWLYKKVPSSFDRFLLLLGVIKYICLLNHKYDWRPKYL